MLNTLFGKTIRKMKQAQGLIVGGVVLFILGVVTQSGSSTLSHGVDSVVLETIATEGAWSSTHASMKRNEYHIAIVADLDKSSKSSKPDEKPTFRSMLKEGILKKSGESWSVEWTTEHNLVSQHNEAGRGMELSELVVFNRKLYTFDDRTGIIFEISPKRKVIPRALFMEGDGNTGKGQKTEWATAKDGVLYSGSFGKEYVGKNGEITSRNNLWVSTMTKDGAVSHIDWTDKYNTIRRTTNSVHPAYQIIETMVWSAVQRKWYCLPRRVSQEAYDEDLDEKRGSNIVITCNEDITSCEKFEVGSITPERGFSSAKFVPGTEDTLMVTLKSEENEKEGTQKTLISIIDVKARKVLMEETEVGPFKYEGVAFI